MRRQVSVRFEKEPRKNLSCGIRYRIVKGQMDANW
jgi:hypothetical protein